MKHSPYNVPRAHKTRLHVNEAREGASIEIQIERIMTNKEQPTNLVDTIYQERNDGVQPAYNIRADRWDIATEATGAIEKSYMTRREESLAARTKESQQNQQHDPKEGATHTQGEK